ncbi:hypothetical protein AJ88_44980 [Mesorhizobium amorphae CCBAU 01583]|nr:hypothetical protein AJ88_44980 [Mesorhizobium amorphae CCBAU 01583]
MRPAFSKEAGIHPIVRIQKHEPVAARCRNPAIARAGGAMRARPQRPKSGIVLHITGDDRGGAVRGGVVDYDRLPIHYFLIEKAIDRARQRYLGVVRRNHD